MTKKKAQAQETAKQAKQASEPTIEELMKLLEAQQEQLAALQQENKELAAKAASKGSKQTFSPLVWGLARGVVGTFINKVPTTNTFDFHEVESVQQSELRAAIEKYLVSSTLANPFKTADKVVLKGTDFEMEISKSDKQSGAAALADKLISSFNELIKVYNE